MIASINQPSCLKSKVNTLKLWLPFDNFVHLTLSFCTLSSQILCIHLLLSIQDPQQPRVCLNASNVYHTCTAYCKADDAAAAAAAADDAAAAAAAAEAAAKKKVAIVHDDPAVFGYGDMKTCAQCSTSKAHSMFTKAQKQRADGICRPCKAANKTTSSLFATVDGHGEGNVHVYRTRDEAEHKSWAEGVSLLEAPPKGAYSYPTGRAKALAIEGKPAPDNVFLVCSGDRGCTNGVAGAYTTKAAADKRAAQLCKKDTSGLSYWTNELTVESADV